MEYKKNIWCFVSMDNAQFTNNNFGQKVLCEMDFWLVSMNCIIILIDATTIVK